MGNTLQKCYAVSFSFQNLNNFLLRPDYNCDGGLSTIFFIEHPKLAAGAVQGIRNVMLAMNLPLKRIPSDGFVSFAWVTTVGDPSEFYLVPKDNWDCICEVARPEPSEYLNRGNDLFQFKIE